MASFGVELEVELTHDTTAPMLVGGALAATYVASCVFVFDAWQVGKFGGADAVSVDGGSQVGLVMNKISR